MCDLHIGRSVLGQFSMAAYSFYCSLHLLPIEYSLVCCASMLMTLNAILLYAALSVALNVAACLEQYSLTLLG